MPDTPHLPSLQYPYDQSTAYEIRDALQADVGDMSTSELGNLIEYEKSRKNRVTVTRLAETYYHNRGPEDDEDETDGEDDTDGDGGGEDGELPDPGDDDIETVGDNGDDPPPIEEAQALEVRLNTTFFAGLYYGYPLRNVVVRNSRKARLDIERGHGHLLTVYY